VLHITPHNLVYLARFAPCLLIGERVVFSPPPPSHMGAAVTVLGRGRKSGRSWTSRCGSRRTGRTPGRRRSRAQASGELNGKVGFFPVPHPKCGQTVGQTEGPGIQGRVPDNRAKQTARRSVRPQLEEKESPKRASTGGAGIV